MGVFVPIPFLNEAGIDGHFGIAVPYNLSDGRFSIFSLGVMPYVSAYVLIEMGALFIPYLKRLRPGSFKGRRQLKQISLFLTLILALIQADAVVSGLKNLSLSDGSAAITVSGAIDHVLLVAILVSGSFFIIALCELISKFGIGHGISVIILSGICANFIDRVPMLIERLEFYDLSAFLIAFAVFCGLVSLAYILLTTKISVPCYHDKHPSPVDYFQFNLAPSSLVATVYAASIIMLPVTLFQIYGVGSGIVDQLKPGSFGYNLVSIVCVFIFSYLFAWAFLHPKRRTEKMRERGWRFSDVSGNLHGYLLRKQLVYNLPWTIFLCLMVVVPTLIISTTNAPFYIGGRSIPLLVAISIDLIARFKFSNGSLLQPIKIAEFHDIYDANMIQNHLKAEGIQCCLQGYHHRLLSYFFGPFIDISLLVDAEDRANAQSIIRDYYGGLGLVEGLNQPKL